MTNEHDVIYGDDTTPEQATAMVMCPYYMGVGSCSNGCYEEPACHVDEPERGWEHYLPESFDRGAYERRLEEARHADAITRWLAAEKRWRERPVLEDMSTTGVYPINPASPMYAKGTRYAAHHVSASGSSATSWHETEEAAREKLAEHERFHERFWGEKEKWKNDGDRTTDTKYGTRPPRLSPFRDVIRVDGVHYVAGHLGRAPGPGQGKGFGGRIIRWRWLDEPEGTVHETDSLWYQGRIPMEWRDRLPDNAVFLTDGGKS
jgi:hypothetical protein